MEKKTLLNSSIAHSFRNKDFFRIMRISLFLLAVCVSQLMAENVDAQKNEITISQNSMTIKQLVNEIEAQTDYLVVFRDQDVDVEKIVSFKNRSGKVSDYLEEIYRSTGIGYLFENNYITLVHKTSAVDQEKKKVTGKIIDTNGEPIIGANIVEKGTTNGVISDIEGSFSLNVASNATLVVSYIGYQSSEVVVTSRNSYQITLSEDSEALDEVIVVGYGTVKKSDLTGSVSTVKAKELTAFTVSDPVQALQGRVPGVVITSNNGSPDASLTVRIRGVNSIRGDNSPLYIIDGIPQSSTTINNYDIESVEVLKDASATAIYGSRGANGVILVTTKKGKTGKTTVEYNFEYGIQSHINKLDVMNAQEWATLINEQLTNDTGSAYFTDAEIAAMGVGTDWQSLVFRNAGMQNHNISLRGGNDKTQFFVSASAMLRDGIIRESHFNKLNLRSSIDHKINDHFSMSLIMGYSKIDIKSQTSGMAIRGGSLVSAAYVTPPTLSPYDDNGNYVDIREAYSFMSNSARNPLNILNENSSVSKNNLINLNGSVTYTPIKDLTIKASLGYEAPDRRYDNYTTSKNLYGSNSASVTTTKASTIVNENIVNYSKTFNGVHSLNVLGGFTYQEYNYRSLSASGSDFLSDITETNNLSSAGTVNTPSTGSSKWVLMSYLGRLNYAYKGRYLLTASIRADGSSRYSEGNKWGYFPSAALAWRISDESFMKEVDFISNMKLRLGYGETGSTAIDPYATLNLLSSGKTPIGGSTSTYFAVSSSYPGDLKWETTAQWNVGLDLGLFDQRLRITADYYNKMTRDLLNSVYLPLSSGYTSTLQNVGKMSNKGVELLVEGDIIRSKDFNWTASVNFARNKNRVEELYDGADIYGSSIDQNIISGTVSLIREGEPIGVFYVFKEDGYDETGRTTYIDVDGDGSYTNADRFILGNPHPDFTYGINSTMTYKNFEFSFFLQGSQGNDIYNMSALQNYDFGQGLNMTRDVLYDHWTPTNTTAKYPILSQTQTLEHSDRFIEDGSYLRLKNISLSYNLPVNNWRIGRWVSGLRLYVSAQNLLTITGYSGVDPEVNSYGSDTTSGIDFLTYPNSKTISFGANIKF